MVSSSQVSSDLSNVESILNNYESIVDGIGASWQGPSSDNFKSQSSEFVSSYQSEISSSFNSFATAVSLYEKYKQTKQSLETAKQNLSTANSNNDKSAISTYNSQVESKTNELNSLKQQILDALSSISSTLSASSNTQTPKAANVSNISTANKSIDTSNIDPNSPVGKALEKYKDQIDGATYATINENLFMLTTKDTINGQEVEVTHIVINDPSQINGSPANGSYGSGKETTSSAAQRLNAAFTINGSHFTSSGTEHLIGGNNIAIVNGEIKTDGVSGGQELLLDNQGRIYNAYGKSAQELVNDGVKYSFACHSTQVIENGDISPSYRETRSYRRQVIGMTEPGEYYVVTDTTDNNKLSDTASYLKNLGVTNAYSLDQGGSVTTVRNNQVINNPRDGDERSVGDVLYVTC